MNHPIHCLTTLKLFLSAKPLSRLSINKLVAILLCSLMIAGCDKAEPPKSSWEMAVQGFYTATLSNDGRYALVGSIQHGGSLWDMPGKERLYNWNHAQGEYTGLVATAISPENLYAATAAQRSIVLWNINEGKPIWFWTAPGDILSMALTPNGDYALLGLDDHSAVLFDIKNGGIQRKFSHSGKVRSVSLSDDAKFVLTGSDDRSAKLWDLQSGEVIHSWNHDNQLVVTALSSTGKYAFTAAQADRAVIWDTATGKELHQMPISKSSYIAGAAYTAARFSQDEQRLLTGTNSQLVQLWDVNNGTEKRRWRVTKRNKWSNSSAAAVMAVSFGSRSNQYYAIASNGLSHEFN